jgi:hypothetical protein
MQRDYQNLQRNGVSGLGSKIKSFNTNKYRIIRQIWWQQSTYFAVNNTGDAEAFAITLEPAGGSLNPTMEQLYTLERCNLLKIFCY